MLGSLCSITAVLGGGEGSRGGQGGGGGEGKNEPYSHYFSLPSRLRVSVCTCAIPLMSLSVPSS